MTRLEKSPKPDPKPGPDPEPEPDLRRGLVRVVLGALAFAAVVLLLPTSRARTLIALLVPMATLSAVTIWWLREESLSRRTKTVGLGSAAAAALFLGSTSTFPAALVAVLWGLPAAVGLALFALFLWRDRSPASRRLAVGAALLVALAPWPLLEADGASGQMMPNLVWVWKTPAVPSSGDAVVSVSGAPAVPTVAAARDWPGFRGPERLGIVPAEAVAELNLDWQRRPPSELWRRPIGPGWSSFAVIGDLACTQDQAGAKERVICLDARTGGTVWEHTDGTRFEELAGGPGPRATPLIHEGRLFALGASGVLNSLVLQTGELVWSVDISGGGESPEWGFASSPLILDDLVYVSPAAVGGARLLALDWRNGERVWRAEGGGAGYSSAQVAVLAGTLQILLLDGGGLAGYEPRTGERLWEYDWPTQLPKVAQPHVIGDDTVIVGMGYGRGTKSLHVRREGGSWGVEERWSSSRFKPKFNDFVIRDGHIFGLDEGILVCVEAATGERLWKGGRYGYGQLVLVGEVLLVVAESGDLVLVEASAAGHNELARIQGLAGKSWSHPALARSRLLVRNGSEAACYDLSGSESLQ